MLRGPIPLPQAAVPGPAGRLAGPAGVPSQIGGEGRLSRQPRLDLCPDAHPPACGGRTFERMTPGPGARGSPGHGSCRARSPGHRPGSVDRARDRSPWLAWVKCGSGRTGRQPSARPARLPVPGGGALAPGARVRRLRPALMLPRQGSASPRISPGATGAAAASRRAPPLVGELPSTVAAYWPPRLARRGFPLRAAPFPRPLSCAAAAMAAFWRGLLIASSSDCPP